MVDNKQNNELNIKTMLTILLIIKLYKILKFTAKQKYYKKVVDK